MNGFNYYSDAGEHGWKDIDWFSDVDDEEEAGPFEDPEEAEEAPVAPVSAVDFQAKVEALNRQVKELRAALHTTRSGQRVA